MVPESARVAQVFGWSPTSWACALVLWCSLLFTQPAKPARDECLVAAAVFALALSLLFYESRRRRNPRVLARFPESSELGIYKHGLLDRTVRVEQVKLELRHSGATWIAILALAGAAVGLAILLFPGPAISRVGRVDIALGSLCCAGLAASFIKVGWFCDFCLFPYEKKQGRDRILFSEKGLASALEPSAKT